MSRLSACSRIRASVHNRQRTFFVMTKLVPSKDLSAMVSKVGSVALDANVPIARADDMASARPMYLGRNLLATLVLPCGLRIHPSPRGATYLSSIIAAVVASARQPRRGRTASRSYYDLFITPSAKGGDGAEESERSVRDTERMSERSSAGVKGRAGWRAKMQR